MNSSIEAGGGRPPGRIDRVRQSFLIRQREEGMALAAESDLLDLQPLRPFTHQAAASSARVSPSGASGSSAALAGRTGRIRKAGI